MDSPPAASRDPRKKVEATPVFTPAFVAGFIPLLIWRVAKSLMARPMARHQLFFTLLLYRAATAAVVMVISMNQMT